MWRINLLLFMMVLLPKFVYADHQGKCGNNLTWTYKEATGTLIIEGSGDMENYGENSIPWKSYRSNIKRLIIKEGVTSIGSYAFWNSGINSVNIPNGVTKIGEYSFAYCMKLFSVTIPSSVTSIGNGAFISTHSYNKPNKIIWQTNTPPNGYSNAEGRVNYVSNDQYYHLSNVEIYPFLSSLFEVDGIKYVPVSLSDRTCDAIDCTYDSLLTNITIPSSITYQGISMSVKKVQPYICYGNTFIEQLSCDNDGEIAQYAFSGCENMKTVTLGEKITTIGNGAFHYCSSLQSLVIPNSVTELGTSSLSGCTQITKISIPKSVTKIMDWAFENCAGLKEFIIEDRNEILQLGQNGSSSLFSSCPLDSIYIGGDIYYSKSPFYRNTSLRTVVITDKETEISAEEFYGCTNLQSFKVGDGVEKFGDWAFSGCSSLKSLSFGAQLKIIGKEAFSDCSSIIEINSKAATPPDCGTQALDDINKWNCKLIVPKGSLSKYQTANQWKDFFFMEESDYVGKYKLKYLVDGEEYKSYALEAGSNITPEAEPTKEGYTFSGWSDIPPTMPDHDVTITGTFYPNDGDYFERGGIKFKKISNTEFEVISGGNYSGEITIPEKVKINGKEYKVTSIGDDAFQNCSEITSVKIPNSVTSIGENAFRSCRKLISVEIPNSIKQIGEWAFCATGLTSVTIPNSVTTLAKSVFNGCNNLESVTIPNSVTTIDYKAFYRCLSLKAINIPNSVTSIGELAFWECRSLTSITIPNSVTSIGAQAFNGEDEDAPNIQTVISLIENPFEIYGESSYASNRNEYLGVFTKDIFNNATLYVPKGTINKYKATNGWKDFLYIEEGTGPNGGETPKKCSTPTINYQNGKLIFNCDTEGATCQYSITDEDVKSGSSNEIQLGVTYCINVYATKTGYVNSETATATLCWIDTEPKTEGITNVAQIRAKAVMIQSNGNVLSVSGADEGTEINVYDTAGRMVGSSVATSDITNITTSLDSGSIGIIRIGEKAVKVLIK